MRSLVIFLITLVAGCSIGSSQKSQDIVWVKKVHEKILLIEDNYLKWEESRKIGNIPSGNNYLGVRHRIWQLWILTGHCLFDDIPCDKLVHNAPIIAERYRKFVCRYGNVPIEEVLLKSMEANIELMTTEYCIPALSIMQQKINFENLVYFGSGYPECYPIPAEDRAKAHKAMLQWLEENKKRFVWYSKFGIFCRDSAAAYRSFTLPADVVKVLEGL
jgi:hypothetical protein